MTQTINQRGEYEQSLYRAFIAGGANYIFIDGRSGNFLRHCTNFALAEKIIHHDPTTSDAISDSQYTALAYRLTDEGRQRLLSLDHGESK